MKQVRCKSCGDIMEVPPEIKIEKQPCKCGMDSEARQAKTITSAVAVVLVAVCLSAFGGCYVTNRWGNEEKIESYKAEAERAKAQAGALAVELEKLQQTNEAYKTILTEVKGQEK